MKEQWPPCPLSRRWATRRVYAHVEYAYNIRRFAHAFIRGHAHVYYTWVCPFGNAIETVRKLCMCSPVRKTRSATWVVRYGVLISTQWNPDITTRAVM